jgi:hypothetical protein
VSAALALTCILLAALVPVRAEDAGSPSAAAPIEALLEGRESVGGPFDLVDHGGRRRTDADFRGKLVLIYLGAPQGLCAKTRQLGQTKNTRSRNPAADAGPDCGGHVRS